MMKGIFPWFAFRAEVVIKFSFNRDATSINAEKSWLLPITDTKSFG